MKREPLRADFAEWLLFAAGMKQMNITPVEILGMKMERWTHETCQADFGVGDGWATLAAITTPLEDRKKGYATELLLAAKQYYEGMGKRFGGTVALSDSMHRLYQRLGITEYK